MKISLETLLKLQYHLHEVMRNDILPLVKNPEEIKLPNIVDFWVNSEKFWLNTDMYSLLDYESGFFQKVVGMYGGFKIKFYVKDDNIIIIAERSTRMAWGWGRIYEIKKDGAKLIEKVNDISLC